MKGQWIGQKGRRYCRSLNENWLFLLCFKGEKGKAGAIWMCYRHYKELQRCYKKLWDVFCCLLWFVCITETTQTDSKKRNEKPAAAIALLMHSEAWTEAWGMHCANSYWLAMWQWWSLEATEACSVCFTWTNDTLWMSTSLQQNRFTIEFPCLPAYLSKEA